MTPLNMPQVGQDIPAARVIEWTKREGDAVRKGEVVAVVESDKATFEVQADQAGVLLKIAVNAGEDGEVFKPIAWIGQSGEQFVEEAGSDAPVLSVVSSSEAASESSPVPPNSVASQRLPCSPSARRLAGEHGVDLRGVRGTGPGGRIQKEDVLAFVAFRKGKVPVQTSTSSHQTPSAPEPAAGAPAGDEVIPFSRMRRRIAERLTLSKRTIPHFHLTLEVDMTGAQEWRQSFNSVNGCHVTVTDLILHATARALAEFPRLNAHVDEDRLLVRKAVNLGVATAVEDGLLVPVIPETDRKTLEEISRFSKQIADAARRGGMDPNVQGTFTVSSLGQFGVASFLPIINPPECGILAPGAIQPRVVPIPGGLGVRQMMTLNLACDHRAVDGVYAARFLGRLKELLETAGSPAELQGVPKM